MILRANCPDNHVITAIGRGDKRRAATATGPGNIPAGSDGRWIGGSNPEGGKDRVTVVVGAERDMGALFGTIGGSCLEDSAAGNLS